MVRKGPNDPGTVTEFKQLDTGSLKSLKRNINKGSGQAGLDGEVVIDGENVGLSEEDALEGHRLAVLQPGGKVSSVVHFILGDGSMISVPRSGG